MFGAFVRLPLLLPFAVLAPVPALVVRLRGGPVPPPLATLVRGGAAWRSLARGRPGLFYLMLVAPGAR